MSSFITEQDFIKKQRATWGLYDLKKDKPILKDEDGFVFFPRLINANMMGTEVYGHELGWKGKQAYQRIKLWCQLCEQQTKEYTKNLKENKPNPSKTKTECVMACTWYPYYATKRQEIYKNIKNK